MKAQSSKDPRLIYEIKKENLTHDDKCAQGFPLRPHVVWFGENVPNMNIAYDIVKDADLFLVVGTSLQVYPAANLIYAGSSDCRIVLIDPNPEYININSNIEIIKGTAAKALPLWVDNYSQIKF